MQLGFTKFEEGRWDRICCQREWKSPYLLLLEGERVYWSPGMPGGMGAGCLHRPEPSTFLCPVLLQVWLSASRGIRKLRALTLP